MEPRTAPPAARLATITKLAQSGIPVGVLVSPEIPGLTDHEIRSLVQAAVEAGARFAGHVRCDCLTPSRRCLNSGTL